MLTLQGLSTLCLICAQYTLDGHFGFPREDTDGLLLRLLPNVNVVRLVMIHWCASQYPICPTLSA